jgi:hypothetical protein
MRDARDRSPLLRVIASGDSKKHSPDGPPEDRDRAWEGEEWGDGDCLAPTLGSDSRQRGPGRLAKLQ